jgi:arylsulfatase A-like enzyme
MVDPMDVPLPAEGTERGAPAWQATVRGQCGTALATEADVRKMIAIYYGMIAYADAEMRRLWQELGRRGLLENTWIVFSSDHGDYLGEKGLFMKTESLYECLLHVPLVIVPPAGVHAPRGETVGGLVELIDLFPTILGLAGVPVPGHSQGKDLVAWTGTTGRRPLRDCAFAAVGEYKGSLKSTFPTGLPEGGRHPQLLQGGRTLEHAFTHDPDYGDEAYDLRRDPWELENLLNQRGAAEPAEVAALRARVAGFEKECLRLRDRLGVVAGYRGFVGE